MVQLVFGFCCGGTSLSEAGHSVSDKAGVGCWAWSPGEREDDRRVAPGVGNYNKPVKFKYILIDLKYLFERLFPRRDTKAGPSLNNDKALAASHPDAQGQHPTGFEGFIY